MEGWTSPIWNGYPTAVWVPEHIHKYDSVVTEPTCTEEGYTTYIYECGNSYVADYYSVLDHAWDDGVETIAPTETEVGEMTYTCIRCGVTKTETIPVCGHAHSYISVVTAPTCTEQGYTTHTCECGDSYIDDYVDALGHDFVDGVCSRCGEEEANTEPPIPSMDFTDVPEGAWYEDAVSYVVENGLMNGVGDEKFAPEDSMTRAMLVTVLWRYAGSPTGYENPFIDLTQNWYMDAVAWAAANSIINGVGDGLFDPDGSITREQMATILYRYCEKVGVDISSSTDLSIFPDGDKVDDWAQAALS